MRFSVTDVGNQSCVRNETMGRLWPTSSLISDCFCAGAMTGSGVVTGCGLRYGCGSLVEGREDVELS